MKTVPFARSDGNPLKLEVIHYSGEGQYMAPLHERVRYGFHRILFVNSGRSRQEIDFEEFDMGPASVLIVPEGAVHRERAASQFEGYQILFTDDFFSEAQRVLLHAFMQYAIAMRKLLIRIPEDRVSHMRMYMQLLEWEGNEPHNQNQTFILQNLMLALLNRLEGMIQHVPETGSFIEKRRPFQQFIQLVEENYRAHKALEFYTSALGLPSRRLNDVLKSLTGQTAAHYLIERIMVEARRELCFSEKSVKEIAYHLGYDNPYYFSRIFKKRTHLSPEQFRAQFAE